MENPAKFINFNTALMAAQMMMYHYAQTGLYVTCSASKNSGRIEVAIFHDEQLLIEPPKGFCYSKKERDHGATAYWTHFEFDYED